MHQGVGIEEICLFRRVRRGVEPHRAVGATYPSEELAKCRGQRLIPISVRRAFGGGGGRGQILSGLTVSHLVLWRLQRGFRRIWHLVSEDRAKTWSRGIGSTRANRSGLGGLGIRGFFPRRPSLADGGLLFYEALMANTVGGWGVETFLKEVLQRHPPALVINAAAPGTNPHELFQMLNPFEQATG